MGKKTYFQYTPPPKTAWDELPMDEKTDIIKSCVRNGIISLPDVRTAYNNYAAEIETFLTEHPDILENSSPYKYIQEVRPGSLKQYAGYFASALGTVPFILNSGSNE